MQKEVVHVWTPQDGTEMLSALTEALDFAKAEGHHPSTVYPSMRRVTLVRETLSDGSHVMNLHFSEGTYGGPANL